MSTYRKADPEVGSLLEQVIAAHHPELSAAGVTIELLCAHAKRDEKKGGEPKGPALKLHGWPCAAIVKINGHKDRVAGCCDARIVVDGDQWPDWTEARREAVLDHELYHLLLARDQDGNVKLDDSFRPKLKMRPHDFELGGFLEICQRHGPEALEAQGVRQAWRKLEQLSIDWDACELAAAGQEVLAGV